VATYGMAAEGLDIKTLSSLIMVTPKTDIVQTVGRILRMRHSQPIIVDIIDSHELFQNQWKQRIAYYRKCNYTVHKTNSTLFMSMGNKVDWTSEKHWKLVNVPKTKLDPNTKGEGEPLDVKKTVIGKCLLNVNSIDFDAYST